MSEAAAPTGNATADAVLAMLQAKQERAAAELRARIAEAPDTITLGGKDYPIARLTLGQLRTVAPASTRTGIDSPEGMAALLTLIHAGMKTAGCTLSFAELDALEGVLIPELSLACAKMMALLTRRDPPPPESEDAPSGEAQPGV